MTRADRRALALLALEILALAAALASGSAWVACAALGVVIGVRAWEWRRSSMGKGD